MRWRLTMQLQIDASATASSVLFVGSAQPVYCVAAVWVSFKSVFFFGLLLLLFQSVSVCVNTDPVTSSPAGASCQSKKNRTAVCSYTEQPRESCTATQQIFNTATAQRPHEAMQVSIQICSRDTGICCRRISIEYQTSYVEYLPSCKKMQY